MLINQRSYQSSKLVGFINETSGSIFNTYSNVSDYFSLQKANNTLVEENIRLRMQLNQSHYFNDTTNSFYFDTVKEIRYLYISSHIINNSTNKKSNYIMIDKGSNHGIEKDMGVLSSNGIVGYIISSSPRFSWILPVLHKNSRFSVKVKKNNQMGTLIWEGDNYKYGTINHIPGHVNLRIGDTIVTSGFSNNFPEGIPVGQIDKFDIIPGEDFYKIKIKFFTDYNSMYDVYVVKNLFKQEQDTLMLLNQNN